jgi:LysR family transcriptional regulator, hypochlorite-specific transcription factor HypT
MELKWLEDFASLARTGSFSRSAEEHHVTQPAFSRPIQALETWLGVALIDRSTYPTTPAAAGREFRETAEEAARMLHGSRAASQASARPSMRAVAVVALRTLALTFFPRWFRQIEAHTGPLGSRLLPDDFHSRIQAAAEGGYDFLLTFHHPSVPIGSCSDVAQRRPHPWHSMRFSRDRPRHQSRFRSAGHVYPDPRCWSKLAG